MSKNGAVNMAADLALVKIRAEQIKPRNTWVVIVAEDIHKSAGGVMLPQTSAESKKWIVVAKGPKVENLEVGDEVEVGQGTIPLISGRYDRSYFVTDEANVILVVAKG